MDDVRTSVRSARPQDAEEVARVYIESWHDTYAAILPQRLLCAMTPAGQSARWRAAIRAKGREAVLVAERAHGIVGMASAGPARDDMLGYEGEVYTLYVDPACYGEGIGRALLDGAFSSLRGRGFGSCQIWAHAKNNARFFYEAMGGKLVAERTVRMMGEPVGEACFGWKKLAVELRGHYT